MELSHAGIMEPVKLNDVEKDAAKEQATSSKTLFEKKEEILDKPSASSIEKPMPQDSSTIETVTSKTGSDVHDSSAVEANIEGYSSSLLLKKKHSVDDEAAKNPLRENTIKKPEGRHKKAEKRKKSAKNNDGRADAEGAVQLPKSSKKRSRYQNSDFVGNNSSSTSIPSTISSHVAPMQTITLTMANLNSILYAPANTLPACTTQAHLSLIPTVEQMIQWTNKHVTDHPPYVHLSSKDSSNQVKILDGPEHRRLTLRGSAKGGYRMTRASHGVSPPSWDSGSTNDGPVSVQNYYCEVIILKPPTAKEIIEQLPLNARLGTSLQRELETKYRIDEVERLNDERRMMQQEERSGAEATEVESSKKRQSDKTISSNNKYEIKETEPMLASHVRVGFAMRTGDLQAPVGYDKWSYGIRDVSSSKIHNSMREDLWANCDGQNAPNFNVGDVFGMSISLVGDSPSVSAALPTKKNGRIDEQDASPPLIQHETNHIRFFHNGIPLGSDVEIHYGRLRAGGVAFSNIISGTYYPAISLYMGATVKVNFGPYFIYPPTKLSRLPNTMLSTVRAMSELCVEPLANLDDVVSKALKAKGFAKKTDDTVINAFKDAVKTEARIRRDAFENHATKHLDEIRRSREERNLPTGDLPADPMIGDCNERSS